MDPTTLVTEAVRIYLAVFFTFVAAFYSTRVLYLKRCEGVEIVIPGARFSPTWWNHMAFRLFRVTIWGLCVARAIDPAIYAYLGPIAPLQSDGVVLAGFALLNFGFGLALVSHFTLGHSWRSGFDLMQQPKLVIAGIYKYSRNPSFLGVMVAMFGFWLALPTWFSTVCLPIGLIAVYRQTLLEEHYLEATLDERYQDYKRRVRRWV